MFGLDGIEIGLIIVFLMLFGVILLGFLVVFVIGGVVVIFFVIIVGFDSVGLLIY